MKQLIPLINLIGFKASHQKIIDIIKEALSSNAKHFKQFNMKSFDFFDPSSQHNPVIYSDSSKNADRVRNT